MMDARTLVLDLLRERGRQEAADLLEKANSMTGTEIIAKERAVPPWDAAQDYTEWPAGAPVADEDQVWTLITPHRAADYQGRPSTLRALWRLAHTTDPERAKPWVDPQGTSGMYMKDECYKAADGMVYRCLQDNCVWTAEALPSAWEEVHVTETEE